MFFLRGSLPRHTPYRANHTSPIATSWTLKYVCDSPAENHLQGCAVNVPPHLAALSFRGLLSFSFYHSPKDLDITLIAISSPFRARLIEGCLKLHNGLADDESRHYYDS